jgi:Tfp pilus assembly protein PilE
MAILAAIAVLAIPTYQGFVRRSRTAEAKSFLSTAQSSEKSFYLNEGSYTACLGNIMSSGDSLSRVFSIGFSKFSAGIPTICGANYSASCFQACFTHNCNVTCSASNNGTFFEATQYDSTLSSSDVTTMYDLANSTQYLDWSYISTNDFLIIAAADSGLVAKNDFLDRLFPDAYASTMPTVYGMDPQGNFTTRTASAIPQGGFNSMCCNDSGFNDQNPATNPNLHKGMFTNSSGQHICKNGSVLCNGAAVASPAASCRCNL